MMTEEEKDFVDWLESVIILNEEGDIPFGGNLPDDVSDDPDGDRGEEV